MANQQKNFQMDPSYNDVASRIVEFREKYPNGTLRPLDKDKPYTLEIINGNPCFVVVAAALRTPDDPEPGVGMAYEPIPGSTPYTRGSELQNAETAAWGRAMIAALAVDAKKGIASREEVEAQNYRAGNQQTQRPAAQGQAQQTPPFDRDQYAGWYDAIDERKQSYTQLIELFNDAGSKAIHPQVLADIKTAGIAAKEQFGETS